jgi:hypothetical protein
MIRSVLALAALFLAALPGRALVPVPLQFTKAPLGNVIRVFSARFHAPFTIEAHAKAPITGDFSRDDLPTAVNAVARQAGLYAIPLGVKPTDGYRLSLKPPPPAAGKADLAQAKPAPPAASATDAEKRRAELLRERAKLLQEAAQL